MNDICSRVETIQKRIEEAAKRGGRDPEEISLVAAVKGVDSDQVKGALTCGISLLGENRVQEAERRRRELGQTFPSVPLQWHMIGHLQRNKVKRAVEIFDMIQSVDTLPLAREVSQRALSRGRRMDVLVEVNTSGEETKFGIPPDLESVENFVERIGDLKGIRFLGLMTLGPYFENSEDARPAFRRLRFLREQLQKKGYKVPLLSMGMTHDFEVAIEEGSTMVRIGTGLFGKRTE